MKQLLKFMAAAAICAAFAFTLSACDDSSTGASDSEITSSDSGNSGDNGGNNPASSATVKPASSGANTATVSSSSQAKATDASADIIKKLKGAADNNGIYSITIELNLNLAGKKGEIEMLYYSKETGTEVQVCDFLAQYEQDASGSTYTTYTFYNGDVNLNLRNKPEIKFTNTFSATTRADRVDIYYTPDGGKKELVRAATADEFR